MMPNIKEAFPTLFALAHERSEASRVRLASMLADIFLNADASLSLREEEIVNELIDRLMLTGAESVRTQFLEKFADIEHMPRSIATNFAKDSIEFARSVLISSSTLTDDDLIQVIEAKGFDHALAIAARKEIGEAVADALVTTGDVRVMAMVAENLGAHLSAAAIDIVADAARYSANLRKPLLHRPEVSADTALKLYWWVEQDLRRYTLKRFGISTGQIDQALSSTISAFLAEHTHEKLNDAVMAQIVDWMDEHQAITPQILPQILRMGHFRVFNMLLARLAHLELSLVDTIISESGGRGLASICRSIGIDKAGFVSLFLLSRGGRPGDQIVHPRELSTALATFDRLSPAIAKDLLHSWSSNPEYFLKHMQESVAEGRI